MRILGLPEQFDLTMKCMIQNATQPMPSPNAVDMYLKPKFPFNLSLALLIEKYMCRIHKSLEELTGKSSKSSAFILGAKKYKNCCFSYIIAFGEKRCYSVSQFLRENNLRQYSQNPSIVVILET